LDNNNSGSEEFFKLVLNVLLEHEKKIDNLVHELSSQIKALQNNIKEIEKIYSNIDKFKNNDS
jgi:hypothetical protein